jgi:hypothetical protein
MEFPGLIVIYLDCIFPASFRHEIDIGVMTLFIGHSRRLDIIIDPARDNMAIWDRIKRKIRMAERSMRSVDL